MKVILPIFFALNLYAEYRVYQYMARPKGVNAKEKIITTTLNPVAFKAYHPQAGKDITIVRTWRCAGHTAKKEICASPYEKANQVWNTPTNQAINALPTDKPVGNQVLEEVNE